MRPNNNLFPGKALILLLFLSCLPNAEQLQAQLTRSQTSPNIILINLDDADVDLLSPGNILTRYPHLSRFVNEGMQFTNFHATTPLCGPSRASLFRGQYAHNTGILSNDPNVSRSNGFQGGMKFYHDQGFLSDDISVWMQNAGYRTMMIGKFLHGSELPIVPEGWDDFFHYQGGNYFGTYRFTNEVHSGGFGEVMPTSTYRTELESADAVNLINRHVDRNDGKPFFMYLSPLAPHNESVETADLGMISDYYRHWWTNLRMPRSPAIDEINYNDKTTALRNIERLDDNWNQLLDKRYRDRVLAMKSVDDMFGAIFNTLGNRGVADNTYIFLTSDNGMLLGHHRLFGKANCFNQATNVPTYVLGPGIQGGQQARHLLAQIDLAPTIVDLAGGQVPSFVDGKSFRPLLFNPTAFNELVWREALLIENWESRMFRGKLLHQGSNAVRFFDEVYAEWADGSTEYYDLSIDPWQIRNRHNQLSEANRSLFSNYLRLLKQSDDEPNVTISSPWEVNALIGRNDEISGMAQDDGGVGSVWLSIRRISDFYYWNGNDWQQTRVRVPATLTNPGHQLTTWRYGELPKMTSSEELVGVWPRVYDSNGKFNRTIPAQIFSIDYNRPESEVLTPAFGAVMESSPLVTGTASDDRSVESIRLVVQNQTTATYFNGNEWQTDWTWVSVPVNEDGTWSYQVPETFGAVYVGSRAVDDSGNVQKPPGYTYFVVLN